MRRSTLSGLFGFFALLLALTADLSAANQEPPFKLETGWLPEHETFLIWQRSDRQCGQVGHRSLRRVSHPDQPLS